MTSRPRPRERTNSVSRSSFSLRMAPVRIVHVCALCEQDEALRWGAMTSGAELTQPAIDVHHRMEGRQGAPILLLSHAMGASMATWDPQATTLSRDFNLLRYDHRGHGGSPVPAGPYTIADLGRDLVRLLNRLELDRVSFCGISLGGMVGLWVAANAPDRIDRLMVCCSAARMMRPQDYAARAHRVRTEGMASIADAVIGRWFTPAFAARRPETVASIRALLLSTPAEGYAGA